MTRQEARERLEGSFMFRRHDDKILLRDEALIEAVMTYEREMQQAKRPPAPLSYAVSAPASFA